MSVNPPRPLVAIVTPVYNGARYLAETMACVQAQTYPHIVHCILDNASTDATPDIIRQFAGGRIPLSVARNPALLPQIDNWNKALRLIPPDAAYFRLLPADDLMVPDTIEKMVALGERHPQVGLVSCQEWMGPYLLGGDIPAEKTVFDGRALVRGSLWSAIGFPHLHCLYRMPRGGLPDPFYATAHHGSRLLATDVDAAMSVLVRAPAAYVHEPLVTTRWHDETVTASDMIPNRIQLWSTLQLIDRWGPLAFERDEAYRACRATHLRYYYRNLMLWRLQGKHDLLDKHRGWLAGAGVVPSWRDYAHAMFEWPFVRLRRAARRMAARAGLVSPARHFAKAPAPKSAPSPEPDAPMHAARSVAHA